MSAPQFSARQLVLLVGLTLVWGLNWPIMKFGVTNFAPLSFRSLSMWLGLPVLYLAVRAMKVPLRIERAHWGELGSLTVTAWPAACRCPAMGSPILPMPTTCTTAITGP